MHDRISATEKHVPALRANSMVMQIRGFKVRCRAQSPVRQVKGYHIYHWTPQLGKYLPCIAPADTMVINFGVNKLSCGIVKSLSKLVLKRHGTDPLPSPSKQQAV